MPAPPDDHGVRSDRGQRGQRGHVVRFGHGVAVEEEQHLAVGRRGPEVAGRRGPEAAVGLSHQPDVERPGGTQIGSDRRPVVGDDHLEPVTRMGLPGQRVEHPVELVLAVVAGHDHDDRGWLGRPRVGIRSQRLPGTIQRPPADG